MNYGFVESNEGKIYYWELGSGFHKRWCSWAEYVEHHIKNGMYITYGSQKISPSQIREVWEENL